MVERSEIARRAFGANAPEKRPEIEIQELSGVDPERLAACCLHERERLARLRAETGDVAALREQLLELASLLENGYLEDARDWMRSRWKAVRELVQASELAGREQAAEREYTGEELVALARRVFKGAYVVTRKF